MVDPITQDVKAVLSELRDVSKDKRRTAVMKLAMIGGDEAVRALIRTLDNDYEDLIVRGRAALLLGKMGDTRAVDSLIRALNAPGYQTPFNAILSLGSLGDERAIDPLLIIYETNNDRLRNAAADALTKLGCDPTTPEAEFTDDPEPQPEPELCES
jgi:HEAT repeat protein